MTEIIEPTDFSKLIPLSYYFPEKGTANELTKENQHLKKLEQIITNGILAGQSEDEKSSENFLNYLEKSWRTLISSYQRGKFTDFFNFCEKNKKEFPGIYSLINSIINEDEVLNRSDIKLITNGKYYQDIVKFPLIYGLLEYVEDNSGVLQGKDSFLYGKMKDCTFGYLHKGAGLQSLIVDSYIEEINDCSDIIIQNSEIGKVVDSSLLLLGKNTIGGLKYFYKEPTIKEF
jgi:hypothetical protein